MRYNAAFVGVILLPAAHLTTRFFASGMGASNKRMIWVIGMTAVALNFGVLAQLRMVAARTDFAYHNLIKQFAERTVAKTYIAVSQGSVPLDEGEITAPIGRAAGDKTKFAVSPIDAKEAYTTYRVIRRFGEATSLLVRIHTGRTHQIRVHFEYLGYPLLGDKVYGGDESIIERPALHALSLAFDHPRAGERMRFIARLPQDMVDLLNELEKG